MGDTIPFFGDHVELSDGGNDFASTVGVGGVVGTQFVIPSLVVKRGKSDLAPEREKELEKWLRIYRDKMLSKGQYLGQLYDIGFDAPETHAIRKDQTITTPSLQNNGRGQSNCAASKTATTLSWTTSQEKAWGQSQDPPHICRLSLTDICFWKCSNNEGRCAAFAHPWGDLSLDRCSRGLRFPRLTVSLC